MLVCSRSWTLEKMMALSLKITGKNAQDVDDEFWMALDFNNITALESLEMSGCPPLPLDHLKMLSCIKCLEVADCNNVFWSVIEEGSGCVQFELPIEDMTIEDLDVSGKELTQVFSYMPKLQILLIISCEEITWLGVVERQEKVTSSATRGFPHSVSGPEAEIQVMTREEEETTIVEEGVLLLPPQLEVLNIWYCQKICLRPDDPVGLQGLCSLHSLNILRCPNFFSSYLSLSSSLFASPFPTSLQELYLERVELAGVPEKTVSLSNLASLTKLTISECGDLRGYWRSHLPPGGCLTELHVYKTRNFFFVDDPSSQSQSQSQSQQQEDDGLSTSPFSVLRSLETDDAVGLLAAPICNLLSSSLTELHLFGDEEIERFTEKQEEVLQLLTALQQLGLSSYKKLRCLPIAGLRGRGLLKLKILHIFDCTALRSLPNGALPNSLQVLKIVKCPAIRSLPKDGLPNSLQELMIAFCPDIRSLPKDELHSSLRLLDVQDGNSEELKSHCRKLIGTIPIVLV